MVKGNRFPVLPAGEWMKGDDADSRAIQNANRAGWFVSQLTGDWAMAVIGAH